MDVRILSSVGGFNTAKDEVFGAIETAAELESGIDGPGLLATCPDYA